MQNWPAEATSQGTIAKLSHPPTDVQLAAHRRSRRPLTFYDSTIRKVLMMPGLNPDAGTLLRVAEDLEALGVQQVILNVFWNGDTHPNQLQLQILRELATRDFAFHISVTSDVLVPMAFLAGSPSIGRSRAAYELLVEAGASTCVGIVGSPGPSGSRDQTIESLDQFIEWCSQDETRFAINTTDVGRADYEFLTEVTSRAVAAGAARVDAHDSYSSLPPSAAGEFIARYIADAVGDVELTAHMHNDFGTATAAAVEAVLAGAQPDVSLLGVSYRSGLAALEEVATTLEVQYGLDTGLDLTRLTSTCARLANRFNLPAQPLKAIVGTNQFIRNLPMWAIPYLKGEERHPASIYDPAVVGGGTVLVWNHSLSRHALRCKLESLGHTVSDTTVDIVISHLDADIGPASKKWWVSDDELEATIRQCLTD